MEPSKSVRAEMMGSSLVQPPHFIDRRLKHDSLAHSHVGKAEAIKLLVPSLKVFHELQKGKGSPSSEDCRAGWSSKPWMGSLPRGVEKEASGGLKGPPGAKPGTPRGTDISILTFLHPAPQGYHPTLPTFLQCRSKDPDCSLSAYQSNWATPPSNHTCFLLFPPPPFIWLTDRLNPFSLTL